MQLLTSDLSLLTAHPLTSHLSPLIVKRSLILRPLLRHLWCRFLLGCCISLCPMVQEEDPVQRVSQGFQCPLPAGRFQLAFPYRNAMPPHHSQFPLHPLVPLLVAYYLCMPVLCSRLRHHEQPAPIVPMPEAPVHKDACPVFPQHYVRFPRQSRMVEPISETTTPQEFAHQHFWLRILSLYRSHAPVPLFRSQFVHSGIGGRGWFSYLVCFFNSSKVVSVKVRNARRSMGPIFIKNIFHYFELMHYSIPYRMGES